MILVTTAIRWDGTASPEPVLLSALEKGDSRKKGKKGDSILNGLRLAPLRAPPGGPRLTALCTTLVNGCLFAAYLEYQRNGQGIDVVFKVNQVMWFLLGQRDLWQ